jgi:hypothetical protein
MYDNADKTTKKYNQLHARQLALSNYHYRDLTF